MSTARDSFTRTLIHFDQASGNPVDFGVVRQGSECVPFGSGHGISSLSKFGANCFLLPTSGAAGFSTATLAALPGTGPYMLSAWLFLTANPSSTRRVLGVGQPSVAKPALEVTSSGVLRLEQRDVGNVLTVLAGSASLTLNQWNHVEAHRDSGGVTRLLINGSVDASTSTVINMGTSLVGAVEVGGRSDSGTGLNNARIDEVIYMCGFTDHEGAFTPETAAYPNPSAPGAAALASMLYEPAFAQSWLGGRSFGAPILVARMTTGGDGRVVGTVTIKGTPNTPVRRRVRLYREIDGVCVGETWSDAVTGAYAFLGFDRAITYTVLAYDGPRVFKATVADGVIPELMT